MLCSDTDPPQKVCFATGIWAGPAMQCLDRLVRRRGMRRMEATFNPIWSYQFDPCDAIYLAMITGQLSTNMADSKMKTTGFLRFGDDEQF